MSDFTVVVEEPKLSNADAGSTGAQIALKALAEQVTEAGAHISSYSKRVSATDLLLVALGVLLFRMLWASFLNGTCKNKTKEE